MALDGESIKINTITLADDPTLPGPELSAVNEKIGICPFVLPVLAVNGVSDDPVRNDKVSFYYGFNAAVVTVVLELWKCGAKAPVDTLTDNTWGEFFAKGFHNYDGKDYGGYLLDFNLVIQHIDGGEGNYFIKGTVTGITGAVKYIYSKNFCLKEYTDARADKTVKIEWYHNRIIGSTEDDYDRVSYKGLNWYNSLRLPESFFGRPRFEYTEEETQYQDGEYDEVDYSHDVYYELLCARLPWHVHNCIRNDVLMSDVILVTDYNLLNPIKPIIQKSVKRANNYEPAWKQKDVENVSVVVEFKQAVNNLHRRIC